MLSPLVQDLQSCFGSVLEDGESGLQNRLPSKERYIANALSSDFAAMRRLFQERDIISGDVSRIEFLLQPEDGVVGMVVYTRYLPEPVLYLRSVRYDVDCDGRRLGDTLLDECGVPARLYRVLRDGLNGCYYVAVFSREEHDSSGKDAVLVDPCVLTPEWHLYITDRTPILE